MTHTNAYEIEIRGRPTDRVLHPVADDFAVEPAGPGLTRLSGEIRDASHLQGILAHLTSLNVEVVRLGPVADDDPTRPDDPPPHHLRGPSTMTTTTRPRQPQSPRADQRTSLARIGGVAALVAAATFLFGIAMFATTLSGYTDPDATPADSVAFLVEHRGPLLAWYIGIFIVFGAALVPFALALRARLVGVAPVLANTATAFAMIWAGLMFATGMVSNIGIEAVADLAGTDPALAISTWTAVDTVTNGLGGGNELVGGAWILLVSAAGLRTATLPRWTGIVGLGTAVAGTLTVVPAFEAIEAVFGLGSIVWFVGIGATLLRTPSEAGEAS